VPPGREPGAQSIRNEGGFRLWEWITGVVGTGMVAGGIFLAVGGRGPSFNPVEEGIGGSVFAFFGLVCVVQAYRWHREHQPLRLTKRLPGVALAVDRNTARRGDRLSLTLTLSSRASRRADHLEVGLVCTELYDYQVQAQTRMGPINVRQTGQARAHEHWQPIDSMQGRRTFSFDVPVDAPYSYEGDCVSFAWRASVREVRQLRYDPRLDVPVWVLP
jgi:hypothetical protein